MCFRANLQTVMQAANSFSYSTESHAMLTHRLLSERQNDIVSICHRSPTSGGILTDWYMERATEIEEFSGQVCVLPTMLQYNL